MHCVCMDGMNRGGMAPAQHRRDGPMKGTATRAVTHDGGCRCGAAARRKAPGDGVMQRVVASSGPSQAGSAVWSEGRGGGKRDPSAHRLEDSASLQAEQSRKEPTSAEPVFREPTLAAHEGGWGGGRRSRAWRASTGDALASLRSGTPARWACCRAACWRSLLENAPDPRLKSPTLAEPLLKLPMLSLPLLPKLGKEKRGEGQAPGDPQHCAWPLPGQLRTGRSGRPSSLPALASLPPNTHTGPWPCLPVVVVAGVGLGKAAARDLRATHALDELEARARAGGALARVACACACVRACTGVQASVYVKSGRSTGRGAT